MLWIWLGFGGLSLAIYLANVKAADLSLWLGTLFTIAGPLGLVMQGIYWALPSSRK